VARQILSLSPALESTVPDPRGSSKEAHALLGSLEQVTRQSLERTTPEPHTAPEITAPAFVPTPTQRAAATLAQAAAALAKSTAQPNPPARPSFATSRDEYRPALGNPSLVNALAELQARAHSRSRRSSLIKATPAATPSASFANVANGASAKPAAVSAPAPEVPLFSADDFLVPEIPQVEATPKPAPPLRCSNLATQAILRSELTPENATEGPL
jgi:hypothetical protein